MFTTELLLHTSAWSTVTEAAKFPNQTVSKSLQQRHPSSRRTWWPFKYISVQRRGQRSTRRAAGFKSAETVSSLRPGREILAAGQELPPPVSLQAWTGNGWLDDAELIKAPLRTEPLRFTVLLTLLRSISVTVSRWVTPVFQFAANSAFNLSQASTFVMSL